MDAQTNPTGTDDPSDTSEFFGGYAPSFTFDEEGAGIGGVIIGKELRIATKLTSDDGEPVIDRWPDGRPKKIAVLTLDTGGGVELALYIRGYMQNDFITALKAQGLKDVELGAYVYVEWTSTDAPKKRNFSGARHYTVSYTTAADYDLKGATLPLGVAEPQTEDAPF